MSYGPVWIFLWTCHRITPLPTSYKLSQSPSINPPKKLSFRLINCLTRCIIIVKKSLFPTLKEGLQVYRIASFAGSLRAFLAYLQGLRDAEQARQQHQQVA